MAEEGTQVMIVDLPPLETVPEIPSPSLELPEEYLEICEKLLHQSISNILYVTVRRDGASRFDNFLSTDEVYFQAASDLATRMGSMKEWHFLFPPTEEMIVKVAKMTDAVFLQSDQRTTGKVQRTGRYPQIALCKPYRQEEEIIPFFYTNSERRLTRTGLDGVRVNGFVEWKDNGVTCMHEVNFHIRGWRQLTEITIKKWMPEGKRRVLVSNSEIKIHPPEHKITRGE